MAETPERCRHNGDPEFCTFCRVEAEQAERSEAANPQSVAAQPEGAERWITDPETGERAMRLPSWEQVEQLKAERDALTRFVRAVATLNLDTARDQEDKRLAHVIRQARAALDTTQAEQDQAAFPHEERMQAVDDAIEGRSLDK